MYEPLSLLSLAFVLLNPPKLVLVSTRLSRGKEKRKKSIGTEVAELLPWPCPCIRNKVLYYPRRDKLQRIKL
ncbi:hypothetical protein BDQ17DRAFT_1385519 [Cyathus striatus]|nr:hypothetical protein BDQ17DRAFT_1385519 [Cyathus striatus]